MAFDQLAVCKDGRRLFPHSCKVPADAVARKGFAASFGLAILQERLRDIASKSTQTVGGFKLEAAHKGAWGMSLRATIDLDVSAL
jgi:hypothetical protein